MATSDLSFDASMLDGLTGLADTRSTGQRISDLITSPTAQNFLSGVAAVRQGNRAQDVLGGVNFSADGLAALSALLTAIDPASTAKKLSKDQAILDSADSTKAILTDILSALPGIQTQGASSGAYNSTAQKLLTDNLLARASAEGSKNQLAYISGYGETLVKQLTPLLQALNVEANMAKAKADVASKAIAAGNQKDSGIGQILGAVGSIGSLFGLGKLF